jgi:zinc/manganese transport system ATP-binding protein
MKNGGFGQAIMIEDLTVAYDREPAVHHLTGVFESGGLTAIVGPNGAGKSTLIKAIVGLIRPDSGRIDIGDAERRDIAYLPQLAEIDRSFPIAVADTVALGLWREIGIFGGLLGHQKKRVAKALATVGLAGFERQPIEALSAGQLQRVLFARLLVQDASIVLLDEPFAAIDERTAGDLLKLIHRWHGEGRTVIAVLHDLDLVRAHFPQSLLMAKRPIAWGATAKALSQEHLRQARYIAGQWTATALHDHRSYAMAH